jgi:enamine deaminase RidA (YjgF/YER057c/UK114 family)
MSIKRIEVGKRMSQAVIHNGIVYLAGLVSEENRGKPVVDQTREVLGEIDRLLALAGSDKTKLLKVNIWLTDMNSFHQMNEAWDGWVAEGHTPARATVESKLAAPGYDVEIMVEAAL